MGDRSPPKYWPALDGLRAAAVLAVLCYHADFPWASGGFLGVDAFFVLSGFLITTLLLREYRGRGRVRLAAFWARRARRLLPALMLVLAAVAAYAAFLAQPLELDAIRNDGLASLGYVANWRFIFSHQSYFAQFSAPSPLKHFWSLAIEEQFYLVWPLLVYVVLRVSRGSVRALAAVALPGALASAALMALLYRPNADPSRVYYGTDTRAQSLLVGALLAMVLVRAPALRRPARIVLHSAGIVAAGTLLVVWSTTNDQAAWLYRGGFLGLAVLVAIVVASVTQARSGLLGFALSRQPMRWIGQISYGLYLWHWPVFIVLNTQRVALSGYPLFAVRVAVTFTASTISYYLVELPIRTGSWRGWRVRLATPLAAGTVAAALLFTTVGAPAAPASVSARSLPPPPALAPGQAAPPDRVVLVGDSVANSLAPGIQRLARQDGFLFWNLAVPGCGLADTGQNWIGYWKPIDSSCSPSWRQRWPAQIGLFNPSVVIALFGAHETFDRQVNGQTVMFDTPAGQQLALSDLADAVNVLGARGARVFFLTAPYYVMGWPQTIDQSRSRYNSGWIDRWNGAVHETVARYPSRLSVLDLNRYLDPDGHWTDTVNGVQVRIFDRMHLTLDGAAMAAQWLMPQILQKRQFPGVR